MSCQITQTCTGCTACVKVCPVNAISGERDQLHHIDPELCIDCESCGRICPVSAIQTEQGETVKRTRKADWLRPTINQEKCVACENCVDVCPTRALSMFSETLPLTDNYAVLSAPKLCVSCNWCLHNCRYDAIKMEVQT